MTNGDDAAFARSCSIDTSQGSLVDGDNVISEQAGLTKREYFAGLAMQGLLSANRDVSFACVINAVMIADVLIAELNKRATEPTR